MTDEELQQRAVQTTAAATELMNQLIAPFATTVDANPGGVETMALVAVLNAYSQMLSENLSLDALKMAAQLQSVIVEQMKKG